MRKSANAREITLNRPRALNALTHAMITDSLLPMLQEAEQSPTCRLITIQGSGGRAFCAGGDVKAVIEAAKKDTKRATEFFKHEYQLNHMIATMKKPMIAYMDGITMGGGVGVSIHAPFRVVTENTVFAMPETAIGLFPDVGGSFFLPRVCDGMVGAYLGITGARLKGQDAYWAGIGTHYVPSARLPALKERMDRLSTDTLTPLTIHRALNEFSGEVDWSQYAFSKPEIRQCVDKCFSKSTVEEIMKALENDGSEFALTTHKVMSKMSPTSLKVALRQLTEGRTKNIAECFQMEYRLSSHILQSNVTENGVTKDFIEGVQAVLVEKGKRSAIWSPSTLEQVSPANVDYFFKPLDEKLVLLNATAFTSYPLQAGLPTEKQIERMVGILMSGNTLRSVESITVQELVDRFANTAVSCRLRCADNAGIRDKVHAYLESLKVMKTSVKL